MTAGQTKTVVITGGAGFVGRHLTAELLAAGWTVTVWDTRVEAVPEAATAAVVNITDPESYRSRLVVAQPAWIVHLAAVASVGAAARAPEVTHQVNVVATEKLLAAVAADSTQTRVLAVSSADIYGQGSTTPLMELPLNQAQPRNAYARSKWEMEQMIEERWLDRVVRVRPFPHIGPGQQRGFVTADFASQIAAVEAGKQDPVIRVGNLEAQRDFTDVRDVVRAYRLLLEAGTVGEVYHVASGRAVSIQLILDQLLALSAAKIAIEPDPTRLRPDDVTVIVGDASKLRALTGWQPEIALDQSLRDILSWWRSLG